MDTDKDFAPISVLGGNDAFVGKLLSACPSLEKSSRRVYFSDEQSVIPFKWEEKPGKPKDTPTLDFVHAPSAELKHLYGSKHVSTRLKSFFIKKPWRILKHKKAKKIFKGNQHYGALDSLDYESHNFSDSSNIDHYSPTSSKGSELPSSKLPCFVKGIHRRLF
ncbi:hypothetical protein RJT34_24112 [Clitoria ternatea]|uniref:Uncharacterized protein n=1 Tax=Clitoria ternatea TaxID=43366 RepID=A0AAN9IFK8_CLITE